MNIGHPAHRGEELHPERIKFTNIGRKKLKRTTDVQRKRCLSLYVRRKFFMLLTNLCKSPIEIFGKIFELFFAFFAADNMSIFSRQKCEKEPKRSRKFESPGGFRQIPVLFGGKSPFRLVNSATIPCVGEADFPLENLREFARKTFAELR
jgi:hypothetical protein